MQLVITEGNDEDEIPVFKSNKFYLFCNESINAVEEAPDGYELWIEQANVKLNQIDNLDIDATQEDDITTITITKKDGSKKNVKIEKPDLSGIEHDIENLTELIKEDRDNIIEIKGEVHDINNKIGNVNTILDYINGEIIDNFELQKSTSNKTTTLMPTIDEPIIDRFDTLLPNNEQTMEIPMTSKTDDLLPKEDRTVEVVK